MEKPIAKIAAALVEAQKNIGAATKGTSNPFFKSKYADLAEVMAACKDALNNANIAVLQPLTSDESGYYVETILMHSSGESLSSKIKLIMNKNDMQQLGSACSYARRYGLQSMVFIPAEDDDGNKATQKPVFREPIREPIKPKPNTNQIDDLRGVELEKIRTLKEGLNISNEDIKSIIAKEFQKDSSTYLTLDELKKLGKTLEAELRSRVFDEN